jgi:hypothetical protein
VTATTLCMALMKRKGPSAADIRKIGNIRMPSDWQPFGGFDDYVSDSDDVSDIELDRNDQSLGLPAQRVFHAEVVAPGKPSITRVQPLCEVSLLQASLLVRNNVPDGTRVVLICSVRSCPEPFVLCHFRVGFTETVVLGQLDFPESDEYELSVKVQPDAATIYDIEVHVSGYVSRPKVEVDSSQDEDEDDEDDEDEMSGSEEEDGDELSDSEMSGSDEDDEDEEGGELDAEQSSAGDEDEEPFYHHRPYKMATVLKQPEVIFSCCESRDRQCRSTRWPRCSRSPR